MYSNSWKCIILSRRSFVDWLSDVLITTVCLLSIIHCLSLTGNQRLLKVTFNVLHSNKSWKKANMTSLHLYSFDWTRHSSNILVATYRAAWFYFFSIIRCALTHKTMYNKETGEKKRWHTRRAQVRNAVRMQSKLSIELKSCIRKKISTSQ